MGQEEVLKLLESNPNKWYSIDEVKQEVNKLNGFFGNVWRQVNRLCMDERVETRLVKYDSCRWGYKRVIKHKENIK